MIPLKIAKYWPNPNITMNITDKREISRDNEGNWGSRVSRGTKHFPEINRVPDTQSEMSTSTTRKGNNGYK